MAIAVFGLTGGIGSGKSTVAARLRQRGLPVVDADALARDAVQPGSAALTAVVERFGANMLDPSGALDRAKLASVVFSDPAARADLNAIVHPEVRRLAERRFASLAADGEPLACYEVPLLFEVGLDAALRPIVVVRADLETRIARTTARDGAPREAVLERIAAQMPLEEKVARADYVIDNAGPLSDTFRATDGVLDAICGALDVDFVRYRRT